MKKIILIVLIALSVASSLNAQIRVTTEDGRKAVLYEDGTWKYYIETSKDEVAQISYECPDLIKTETDKMTDRITTSSKERLVISDDGGKTGFGIGCIKASNLDLIIKGRPTQRSER